MIDMPVSHAEHVDGLRVRDFDFAAVAPVVTSVEGLAAAHAINYDQDTQSIADYTAGAAVLRAIRLAGEKPGTVDLELSFHSLHPPKDMLAIILGVQPPDEHGWESVIYGDTISFVSLTAGYLVEQADRFTKSGFERINGRDTSFFLSNGATTNILPTLGGAHEVGVIFDPEDTEVLRATAEVMQQSIHPELEPHIGFILSREVQHAVL